EICDLIYHTLVMMVEQGISIEDVENVLRKRAEKSGNLKEFHKVDKNS
ncbi:MAG: phosphoribosyl-ATP pyrophosphatase, partial [Eubacterium sp.]|nr:phosphoribosyl-ATP pyrophosphatase [Eubacterium sp.]